MLDSTNTTNLGANQPQSRGGAGRRTLALGGMATIVAGFAAVPSIEFPAPANTDANVGSIDLVLIQLCDRIVAVRGEQDQLQQVMYDLLPDNPEHDPSWHRIRALDARANVLAEQIGRLPARTMAGVQARAAALKVMMPVDYEDDCETNVPINWHCGMLDALLRDLTEGVGA